ncbi:MAG: hypothetical protein ACW97Z_10550 [Candidatus Hodarchaeales archaeon]
MLLVLKPIVINEAPVPRIRARGLIGSSSTPCEAVNVTWPKCDDGEDWL